MVCGAGSATGRSKPEVWHPLRTRMHKLKETVRSGFIMVGALRVLICLTTHESVRAALSLAGLFRPGHSQNIGEKGRSTTHAALTWRLTEK